MTHAFSRLPAPYNETIKSYAPHSPERASLRARVAAMAAERIEIPCIIGGKDVRTGRLSQVIAPHDHGLTLADVHFAGLDEIASAIAAANEAWQDWSRTPWEERAAVFLRAADLLSGPWRDTLNAATMLGQSKTPHQAEIDAACETIDFWRFNTSFMAQIYADQPISSPGVWNRMENRPLEGFVLAITPFNFTSIGINLPTSPALMGNTVLWKPASTAMLSAYYNMRLLQEAGLPDGVINLVYGRGTEVAGMALGRPELAGVHFTGSTDSFRDIWRTVGGDIERYRNYPRIVGETGGKGFIVVHPSAEVDAVVTAAICGAFEYQGQKCSAATRLFVPASLWPRTRERLIAEISTIKIGDPTDFSNFMGAVIDAAAFETQRRAIDEARSHPGTEIIVGGGCDDSVGWFVEPTVVVTDDPDFRLLKDELFGPVLTTFVYDDADWASMLRMVDGAAQYGLTGSIFARNRRAIREALDALRHTAGNLYINDKPTGAVVGQQPFGGARASGTNDKAGSLLNLIRWTSPRAIKESLVARTDYRYPFLEPDD